MKYIDIETLKAEIEELQKSNSIIANNAINSNMRNFYDGEVDCCKQLLSFIDSLQQKPQEEICSKCVHHHKDDDCYYPYGGMQYRINENGIYECTGFCEKEQKQPKVDLEKEIKDKYLLDTTTLKTRAQYAKLATYFYELGQCEMRNRITNPEYNKQVVERIKSEHPIVASEEELKKAIKERYPMPEDADAHTRDRIAAARNGFLSGYSWELGRKGGK